MKKLFRPFNKSSTRAGTLAVSALTASLFAWCLAHSLRAGETPPPAAPAQLPPLTSVRLLDGPFADAVKANRTYLLALDPDRLLAPFFREGGLEPKARPYGNWESGGLDGHTAGHYLSALAAMIASGADTPDRELRRRLDYMVSELERCQKASDDGYLGGVPDSRELWKAIAAGNVEVINRKWVPWYNLHKTFAGLRDAYWFAGNRQAREILVRCGDWCEKITSGLSDDQMQRMLGQEHGGMNEVLADLYTITGNGKYLRLALRFCHKAVLDPLKRHEDQLTGKHANTQIPKVVGLERIATLTGDREADSGARFFWENVTGKRSVAFGGNSVSEHFNDPKDFAAMLEHREGPETCNTYNMLRLTGQLFASQPKAVYADFYERALYNHILASINSANSGYVYFTPIRPGHYRVYSQPDKGFWCCVGTGMENPGRYGEFIYAQATNGLYVNLFIASEITATNLSLTLRQETAFPDEPRTTLKLKLQKPAEFTLYLRHPGWVAAGAFAVRVNGNSVDAPSTPSSYAELRREWRDGDRVEIEVPMRTTVEPLPDGSDWVAILRGPIVLASPAGTNDLRGLYADDSRMGHVASGPLVPMDRVPVLLAGASDVLRHIKPDPAAGPMHFRLADIVEPPVSDGLPLMPFFRLHDQRYQMYWQLTTKEELAAKRERLAAEERAKATQTPPAPIQPAGIVIVPSLEKPKTARKLEEEDFGGYLMVYFKDQTQSAYMAISRDGYTFTDLNGGKPIFDGTLLAEQKGVRDPHIARGPDGAFYLAMTDLHIFGQRAGHRTTQWERPQERYGWGNNRAIVLMKSYDLIHWTHSDFRVDKAFAEFNDIGCSWAPETVYDEQEGKMMVYFTMRMGGNPACHMYYSHTDDAFTKLETTPARIPDIGGIDGDITKVSGKFHLFYVSDAKIRHAVSDRINRGYQAEPERIDPNTVPTEAPNVFKRLGTDTYVLMYDVYGARPNNMGFSETTDFIHYTDIGRFNEGVMKGTNFNRPKHGAVTYLTPDELRAAAQHWKVDIKLD